MKRKFLSILTAIVVAASLSACQAGDTGQTLPLSEAVVSETTVALETAVSSEETTAPQKNSTHNPIEFEITDWTMEELVSNMVVENHTFSLPCDLAELSNSFKSEYTGYSSKYDYSNANLYIGDRYIAQISFNGNLTEKEIEKATLISFFMNDIYGLPQFDIMGITNQSTRREVVNILGKPNITSENELIFQYAFSENERIIIGFNDESPDEMSIFFIIYNTEEK